MVETSAQGVYQPHDLARVARIDNLELVVWLQENCRPGNYDEAMANAAANNHLHVIKWLHEKHGEHCLTTKSIDTAAESGHLKIIKWLHENRKDDGCTTSAMDKAAKYGHLDVLKWLHENRKEGCSTDAMDYAASVKIVEWLHVNRTEDCTTKAMNLAAIKGDVDTVLFLHQHRAQGCTTQGAIDAMEYGHVILYQWLIETYPDTVNLDRIFHVLNRRSPILSALRGFGAVVSKRQRIK